MELTSIRWVVFRLMALYLALVAIYRVVIPANGLPAPSFTYKMIWVDIILVAMFVLWRVLLGNLDDQDERRKSYQRYFWIGLIGGAVIIGIRFLGGGDAYWSGHLFYRLRY